MKTSVVMACYNGGERIFKQLDSLKNQTRHPDEVILVDDCSTDHTGRIIREFISANSLDHWTLHVNKKNIGWKRNFFHAMCLADGDLIFPCDQDDEWDLTKVEQMAETMEENPSINILACSYRVEYGTDAVKHKTYSKSGKEKADRISPYVFTSRFFQNPSPGCTYAVRRTFFHSVKNFWFPEAPHDEFLWLLAILSDSGWFLNQELLTLYRYDNNASDIRYKDIPMQKENLRYIEQMLGQMKSYALSRETLNDQNKVHMIDEAAVWCKKRQRLMETRNPLLWVIMIPYWKYYNSFRNCLSDLYLVIFGYFKR